MAGLVSQRFDNTTGAMMDVADVAAKREAEFLAEALSKHAHHTHGGSLSHCEDRGVPIPEARQKAVPGVRLCVACQTILEKSEGR